LGNYSIKQNKLVAKLVGHLAGRPYLVLVSAFLVTLISSYMALGLHLEADMAALLPENTPSVRNFHQGMKILGNVDSLVILADGKNKNIITRACTTLVTHLRALKEIKRVEYKLPKEFFEKRALLFLDEKKLLHILDRLENAKRKKILASNPLYVDLEDEDEGNGKQGDASGLDKDINKAYGKAKDLLGRQYLASKDGLKQVVLVTPKKSSTDLGYDAKLLGSINHVIGIVKADYPAVRFRIGGSYKTRLDEHGALMRDLKKVTLVSSLAILAAVVMYFSRFAAILYVIVPLIVGISLTLGLSFLLFGRLNTVSGFIGPILFGLGIDFGIHLLARYDEERRKGANLIRAINISLSNAGRSGFTGAITTAAAFFAISVADFKGFSEFGTLAGLGVLICFFSFAIMLPPMLIIGEKVRPGFLARKRPVVDEASAARFVGNTRRAGRFWLLASALLGIIGLWSVPNLRFQYDFRKLRSQNRAPIMLQHDYMSVLKLSIMPAVISSVTLDGARRVLDACELVHKSSGEKSSFKSCVGISDFLPAHQGKRLEIIEEISDFFEEEPVSSLSKDVRTAAERLKKLTNVQPFTLDDLPKQILDRFTAGKYFLTFIYPSVELWDARNDMKFSNELARIRTGPGDLGPLSQAQVFADMFHLIKTDGVKVLLMALLLISFFLLADFRNFKKAGLASLPLLLALCTTSAILVLDDTKISFYNMLIIPAMLGMGVDSGVHLVHRYSREGPGGLGVALRATGGAVTMSLFTTILGFFGLLFADHPGLRSMGELAVIGLTITFLATMGPLPALLLWLEKRNKRI